jgi:ribosome maturation factor RimP
VQPIIEQQDAELYDLEYESGILRIAIDREGGIDVDTIGELSRLISDALDREDPIPDSKYMLEVTSPGVERKLRTPEHFRKQVGEVIAVKLRVPIDGARRFQAPLLEAGDDAIELAGDQPVRVAYADIESARSVYDWDAEHGDTRKKSEAKQTSKSESSKKKAVS